MTFTTRSKLLLLHLTGRNPFCSWDESIRGYDALLDMHVVAARLESELRVVREESGIQLFETPYGPFWAPLSTDVKGLALILAEREVGAYNRFDLHVKKGDIVLDCGANVGVFTRYALESGAASVICFEPFEVTAECLRRNVADDIASGRVGICQKGVWNREESLDFIVDPHNAGGCSFITKNKDAYVGPRIPVTTIDQAVKDLNLARVDFIKMDIEAAETRALEGAEQTLRKYRPRLAIAVEHTPDRVRNAREVIQAARKSIPDVVVKASFCYVTPNHVVTPEVLYFA
jgi:FkbM family methyltransferase